MPAVDAAGWPKLKAVCAQFPGLHPAYGLHPMYLAGHRPAHLRQLREWIRRERPAAVGECGLDHFVEGLDPARQQYYFDGQLALAVEFGLPVIVHARRAVDAVIAAIRRFPGVRAWTNNGADNDSVRVGGLLSSMPDDPNPVTGRLGYACCL